MCSMKTTTVYCLAAAALIAPLAFSENVAWREDLYLGRGEFWQRRVPITVTNPTDEACEGQPVALQVGRDLPIAGARVEELRLVDETGGGLLFSVWGDERIENGPVPEGAEVSIPVSLPAKGSATYWLYWDNPSAWGYADFFKERASPDLNGGFEKGNATAFGWNPSVADASHRLAIDTNIFASGKRALRAETDPDAKPSWFSFSRHDITVVPGATVTIRVKVRGENVKGTAGWYVHIGDKKKSDIVNRVVKTGSGTFEWKETVITLKVPEGCTRLATGSVLRGTGKAWYDDFSFDPGIAPPPVSARAGAVERLPAARIGEDAPWADPAPGAWELRAPVRLANFSAEATGATLVSFNVREALHATRDAEFKLMDGPNEVPLCVLGDRALFTCPIPAQTVKTYWLYARTGKPRPQEKPEEVRSALGSPIPSDQVLVRKTTISDESAYAKLLASDANLLKNSCFDDGMAGWTHSTERKNSRISYGTSATGGKFGAGFGKMTVPADERGTWRGIYQKVAIKPERRYFYGGFLSTDNVDSPTSIHLHKHDRKGKNTLMTSTSGSVSGTTPWSPAFGTFATYQDDATVTIHLTTQGHGTFAYDGLIIAEYAHALVGTPQMRPGDAAASASLAVQSIDPVIKVFRETPVKDARSFEVSLAQNETEPLQLAVRSPKAIGRLDVEVVPPRKADGTGGISVETGWVEYVPVDYPTSYYSSKKPEWTLKYPTTGAGSDGWSGWWPDPIAPVNAGPVAANTTQPVWINVKTAADTKPGTYKGRIIWKADGQVVREDAYAVRVWDFALPAIAETPAIYDLRLHSKWWKSDFEGLDADARRRLLWKFNSEKRICPDSLGAAPKFTRGKDGKVTADFTEYDRIATEYFEEFHFPVSYTPGMFYCFGWAMPPKKFLGEDPYPGEWPYEGADRMKLRPEYKKVYQEALRLYWDHVKAKGWADRLVLYISDEPHFSRPEIKTQMIACCKMIHEVDPSIRIYSSTWRHCPEWNDSIDVWGVGHYGNFPVAEMEARAAAGKHIWFTTDGQMCLDTPYCAVERMLPHYCAAYHAEAYEFWGSTWLTYDPWKFGWHSYIPQSDTPGKHYFVRYPDGDGYLIYPGVPGRFKGPVTSVRLEAARDGVEDFSYLKRIERLAASKDDPRAGRAKSLLAEFRALVTIPNAGGRYSTRILPEPEKIGILRRKAGDLLDASR